MNILLVEDDLALQEAIQDTLVLQGFQCHAFASPKQALSEVLLLNPQIVISDINMPEMNGFELLDAIKKIKPDVPIVLMTAYGNVSDAVKAMHAGANDYLAKPFEPDVLLAKMAALVPSVTNDDDPIAADPQSIQTFSLAKKVAQSDVPVLISGPSGTGKEVLARYIHQHSPRQNKSFVAINCAAIPENMLEATLFGYEKGAFTGALKSHPGKFEQAQDGTLLLDEISEMKLDLQAKLLRVLQEQEVERLGGRELIQLNVRIIATTNRHIQQEVIAGHFREDLYYRLNVFPLSWQPLCERPKDIIPLAEFLLARHAQKQARPTPQLAECAKEKLVNYAWPGNIREMENAIQRALILSTNQLLTDDAFLLQPTNPADGMDIANNEEGCLSNDVKQAEYQAILKAYHKVSGNRKALAEQLGISPRTLRYKLAKMRDNGLLTT